MIDNHTPSPPPLYNKNEILYMYLQYILGNHDYFDVGTYMSLSRRLISSFVLGFRN